MPKCTCAACAARRDGRYQAFMRTTARWLCRERPDLLVRDRIRDEKPGP